MKYYIASGSLYDYTFRRYSVFTGPVTKDAAMAALTRLHAAVRDAYITCLRIQTLEAYRSLATFEKELHQMLATTQRRPPEVLENNLELAKSTLAPIETMDQNTPFEDIVTLWINAGVLHSNDEIIKNWEQLQQPISEETSINFDIFRSIISLCALDILRRMPIWFPARMSQILTAVSDEMYNNTFSQHFSAFPDLHKQIADVAFIDHEFRLIDQTTWKNMTEA